ncbi:MAG TPA: adenylate/guanylate cyclase domain-containing protein [Gemmatimonadota bacterium]|nr:adenylate/guanylate cyclase domain-containing protein [Gemmatimonadota bacterium]
MARDSDDLVGRHPGDRLLAAVLFADIVGFSGLSSRDEDAAMKLVEVFQAVTRRAVKARGGRVVKFLGDGGLAVFPSADGAVRAGLAVQRNFQERSAATGNPGTLRVGIHLGEVVSETDGDVYGDGVNTAARIQDEAEPGQVVVSDDIWRQLRQRSGYRFDVLGDRGLHGLDEPVRLYAVAGAPGELEETGSRSPETRRPADGVRRIAVVGAMALSVALIGWWLSTRLDIGRPSAAEAASSIAVLPFTDMSPGGGQEYFGDGITEELINALTKLEGISVVSRTSAFAFKGENVDVREIGRRLEVGNVLEGSIRVAGDRLRVTARLVDVEDGIDLWSDSYDREMEDVFAIQEEIARSIVAELEPQLASAGGVLVPARTRNPEAYQLYLQGRYFWNQRTREGLTRAAELFGAAIRSDSTYALAYAGMADVYNTLRQRGFMTSSESVEKQRVAAQRAVDLDPDLSEAHTSLAQLLSDYDWEWETAGREFERAVALDPRNANARHWYSHYLTAMSRETESLEHSERAIEISPYDIVLRQHLGWHYLFARDFAQALEVLDLSREMDPGGHTTAFLALAYDMLGRNAEGRAECERGLASTWRQDAFAMGFVGFVCARLGHRQEVLELADELEQRGDQTYYAIALIHAGLGDRDRALGWLERGYEAHSPGMIYLRVDPRLDDLRSDPRFVSLMEGMRL